MTLQQEGRLTQAMRTDISDKKMLQAAVELINERGPAGTSLKEVGLVAGYSRGLAGQRFGSKDKLFAFVLKQVGDIWLDHLKRATRNKTGLAALHYALDEHYNFCLEAPDHFRTFYTLWFESVNAGVNSQQAKIIQNIHMRRYQDVVKWILDDFDIEESVKANADNIAALFCASVIGIVYCWLANPSDLAATRKLHDDLKKSMATFLAKPDTL